MAMLSIFLLANRKPGILFELSMVLEADKRMQAEIAALKMLKLPPMPGFERMCDKDGSAKSPGSKKDE